ncbi:MAG: ankyrin repeat domain-containing protein [Pseudomonadota bacterium]
MKKIPRDDWFERERLHRAAEDGDISEVERLVNAGSPLDIFDDISYTPLHYAVRAERYKVVQLLLSKGANVNACDFERIGDSPLAVAARGEYPEMVELLLTHGADPDIPGWMAITARLRAKTRKDEDGQEILALIERYCPSTQLSERER